MTFTATILLVALRTISYCTVRRLERKDYRGRVAVAGLEINDDNRNCWNAQNLLFKTR